MDISREHMGEGQTLPCLIRTRGQETLTLVYIMIRKRNFSQTTINEWNKLCTGYVNVSSVNKPMFKNKIHTCIRRASYTQMDIVGLSLRQWRPCPFAIWVFALDLGNHDNFC